MLPNESLLVVLYFADCKTLVLAKVSGRHFLRLVKEYAEELARRRRFRVTFFDNQIEYEDVTIDAWQRIGYQLGNQASLATACRELASVIEPHTIANLQFYSNTWKCVILDAAPSLTYAEDVKIKCTYDTGSTIRGNLNAFVDNFAGMKSFRLWLNIESSRLFSWTFLNRESACELGLIQVVVVSLKSSQHMNRFAEDLVSYRSTHTGGEALEIDFSQNDFSGSFGMHIIELLKSFGREMTFRMWTPYEEATLVLDEMEYTVDFNDTTTRYSSKKGGIVVEVKGRRVAIHITVGVPWKKPRTADQALPMIVSAE